MSDERGIKAVLEFPIPENDPEFRDAIDGWKYKVALQAIDERCRTRIKWGEMDDSCAEGIELARKWLHEECDEMGIKLWD